MAPLLAATLALLATAFWAAPATVYLFNADEVTTPLPAVIGASWPWQVGLLVAALALGAAGRARGRTLLTALLLAVAAVLYVQGNVLVRSYGRFDGGALDWSGHRLAGVLDAVVWLGLPVAAIVARRRVERFAVRAALVLVLLNGVALGAHLLSGRSFTPAATSGLDERFAEFSRDRNALVVVLDAFAAPAFERILADDPAWRERLDGFTWYRDALAAYPTTLPSIPAILSGRTTDNERPVREFLRESLAGQSLPVVLQRHGYATTTITEPIYGEYLAAVPFAGTVSFLDSVPRGHRRRDALAIWNLAAFRYAPHQLKRQVYADGRWWLREPAAPAAVAQPYETAEPWCVPSPNQQASRLLHERLLATATAASRRPTFKFLHFFTPHLPYFLGDDCRQLTKAQAAPYAEDRAAVTQAACALRQVQELLDRLRQLGVLDDTLVIITGDHGSHVELMPELAAAAAARGLPSPSLVQPLLLAKPIGARGALAVSDAPVSLTDLAATVADGLGIAASFPGRPLGAVLAGAPRPRTFRAYTWKHEYWWEEYLPPLTAWRVDGPVRDPAAWTVLGAEPAGAAAPVTR